MRLRRLALVLPACLLLAVPVAAAPPLDLPTRLAPEAIPDRLPVASEPIARGALVTAPAPDRTPTSKAVDGDIGDWVGEPSRIGGTARFDAGEHIYSDFLFDAYGADDGGDAERLAVLGPLAEAESRTARIDQLFQAAGSQFGAPRPFGASEHYGDATRIDDADLSEVRWAAQDGDLHLLARLTTMLDAEVPALLVLADTDGATGPAREVGLGSGLTSRAGTSASSIVVSRDLGTGAEVARTDAAVAVEPEGWVNAIEASLPADLLAPDGTLRVAVVSAVRDGDALVPANAAYRGDEPVAGLYNERTQALELHAGTVDRLTAELVVDDLRRGRTETARPGPGYHERIFTSGENISRERREDGILQRYGLYVPTSHDPSVATPLHTWLHYRGGKAHNGAAWTPRLITQLGEEQGAIVATPHARGTSTWYVSAAHQDFFEVFADVHVTLLVDEDRRYLSGYSMGGYGTYLFGLLYPDLFAGGYSTSGATTQGAWTGFGPDDATCREQCFIEANEGDADAQLAFRILDNARHLPLVIHHGSNDQLVPVTGVTRFGARLAELGYRHELTIFHGYEHFTQAIVDEWSDGADYLAGRTRDPNPRHVTYRVVPALIEAVNTVRAGDVAFDFAPDGAYWVDGLAVRDGDASDTSVSGRIDVISRAIPAPATLPLPRAGAV
jgi:dienelactone hydrolase